MSYWGEGNHQNTDTRPWYRVVWKEALAVVAVTGLLVWGGGALSQTGGSAEPAEMSHDQRGNIAAICAEYSFHAGNPPQETERLFALSLSSFQALGEELTDLDYSWPRNAAFEGMPAEFFIGQKIATMTNLASAAIQDEVVASRVGLSDAAFNMYRRANCATLR